MRNIGRRLSEAKSARAFAFEVGVVVVGVLIALGAQELVDDWTWQRKADAGEDMLRQEAADGSLYLVEQVVTVPCVIAQIDRLSDKLKTGGPWKGAATYPSVAGDMVIRAPSRSMVDTAWQSLVNDGTAVHFDDERRHLTSSYYRASTSLDELLDQTETLRARLNVAAVPLTLGADSRFLLLQTLGDLRYRTLMQKLVALQMLESLRQLGRLPPREQLNAQLAAIPRASTIGECRAQGLPLGNWERELAKRSS